MEEFEPTLYASKRQLSFEDRQEIFEKHSRQAIELARLFHLKLAKSASSLSDCEDFTQIALCSLWEHTERFDPAFGSSFWTWARRGISGSLIDYLRRLDWMSRCVRERITQIEKQRIFLEQKLGRSVGFEESFLSLGHSAEDMAGISTFQDISFVSIDYRLGSDQSDGNNHAISDIIPDPNAIHPSDKIQMQDQAVLIARALDCLTTVERRVVKLYFWSGIRTNVIGTSLEITESRVSQIMGKAFEKMKKRLSLEDKESCDFMK